MTANRARTNAASKQRKSLRGFRLHAIQVLLMSTGLAASLPTLAFDREASDAADTGTTTVSAATFGVADSSCARPAIMFNRWQENWSTLANSCVPRQPFDSLKYIPLFGNPDAYISLGMVLRERL